MFLISSLESQSISIIKPYKNQKTKPGEEIEIQWVIQEWEDHRTYTGKLIISYSVSSETFDILTVNAVEESAYWIIPAITGDDVHIMIQLLSSPYTLTTIPIVVPSNNKSKPSKSDPTETRATSSTIKRTTAPINLKITRSHDRVSLDWNNPDRVEYRIFYKNLGEIRWQLIALSNDSEYGYYISKMKLDKALWFRIENFYYSSDFEDVLSTPAASSGSTTTTGSNFWVDVIQDERILNLYWNKHLGKNIEFGVYYQEAGETWTLIRKVYGTQYSWKVPKKLIGKKIFIGIRDESSNENALKSITIKEADTYQQDQDLVNMFYCVMLLYLISLL